jgi:5-bromo-4-chloroindolyl phosphate hydrolysis protein
VLNWECVFDELGVEQDWWRFLYADTPWAMELSKRFNDLSERTAGSINNGSRLTGMRLLMAAIQRHGRYN